MRYLARRTRLRPRHTRDHLTRLPRESFVLLDLRANGRPRGSILASLQLTDFAFISSLPTDQIRESAVLCSSLDELFGINPPSPGRRPDE
jgi:hypothetical protein